MENGFAILLLILAGVLLLYAAIQARTKSFGMVGRNYAAGVRSEEDKKAYAVSFAKILAAIGLILALGGACGLWFGNGAALVAMAVAFILLVIVGKRRSGDSTRD